MALLISFLVGFGFASPSELTDSQLYAQTTDDRVATRSNSGEDHFSPESSAMVLSPARAAYLAELGRRMIPERGRGPVCGVIVEDGYGGAGREYSVAVASDSKAGTFQIIVQEMGESLNAAVLDSFVKRQAEKRGWATVRSAIRRYPLSQSTFSAIFDLCSVAIVNAHYDLMPRSPIHPNAAHVFRWDFDVGFQSAMTARSNGLVGRTLDLFVRLRDLVNGSNGHLRSEELAIAAVARTLRTALAVPCGRACDEPQ